MSSVADLDKIFREHEIPGKYVVAIGAVVLAAYAWYHRSDFDWKRNAPKIAFLILGAVAIDSTVHALLTSPFEYTTYWMWKFVAGSIVSIWLLQRDFTNTNIAIGAIAFAGFISIYYRSLELITGLKIGAHVPNWQLGSHSISFAQDPWLSTLLWAILHTSAYGIPAWALRTYFPAK